MFEGRVRIVDATFGQLPEALARNADFIGADPIVGVLMDLGVSSHQLDDAGRGFSFRADAPLDMRMDPTRGETAAQFLSRVDQHQFVRLLRENGESRFAGSIAKSVLERQPQTTNELSEAVERAVPMAARRRGHVATRVFQALRIAVNSEEDELTGGLDAALDALGRRRSRGRDLVSLGRRPRGEVGTARSLDRRLPLSTRTRVRLRRRAARHRVQGQRPAGQPK